MKKERLIMEDLDGNPAVLGFLFFFVMSFDILKFYNLKKKSFMIEV